MIPTGEDEDSRVYTVVVNGEEQYSIWPAGREIPAGWRSAGRTGPKAECLAYINDTWTDMRPLSLRTSVASASGPGLATSRPPPPPSFGGGKAT
jgi:MbtH protein